MSCTLQLPVPHPNTLRRTRANSPTVLESTEEVEEEEEEKEEKEEEEEVGAEEKEEEEKELSTCF